MAPTSSPRVGCTATMSLGFDSISRARISRWRLPPESSRAWVSIDGAAMRYSVLSSSAERRAAGTSTTQPRAMGASR